MFGFSHQNSHAQRQQGAELTVHEVFVVEEAAVKLTVRRLFNELTSVSGLMYSPTLQTYSHT